VSNDNLEDTDPGRPAPKLGDAPHSEPVLPERRATTQELHNVAKEVAQDERKIRLMTLVNVGMVVIVLALAGGFAAWVLSSSKSYAQTVDGRVDRLETRFNAQDEKTQRKLDRQDEKIDGVRDQLTDVKILLTKLADAGAAITVPAAAKKPDGGKPK